MSSCASHGRTNTPLTPQTRRPHPAVARRTTAPPPVPSLFSKARLPALAPAGAAAQRRGAAGGREGTRRRRRGRRPPPNQQRTRRAGTAPDARAARPLGTAAGHRCWAPPLDAAARRRCGALLPGTVARLRRWVAIATPAISQEPPQASAATTDAAAATSPACGVSAQEIGRKLAFVGENSHFFTGFFALG